MTKRLKIVEEVEQYAERRLVKLKQEMEIMKADKTSVMLHSVRKLELELLLMVIRGEE